MLWMPQSCDPKELSESFEDFDSVLLKNSTQFFPESVIILKQRKLMMAAINTNNEDGPKNDAKLTCNARLKVMNEHAIIDTSVKLKETLTVNLLHQLPHSSKEVVVRHIIRSFFVREAASELREQQRFNQILSPDSHTNELSEHDDELIRQAYEQHVWSFVLHQRMKQIYEKICQSS